MTLKSILCSWDTGGAVVVAGTLAIALPSLVPNALCKDIYGIGITVLSIVFSVYLAAMALIMASSDDEFVVFLEARGYFRKLISYLRYSLWALFLALLAGLGLYTWTSFSMATAQQAAGVLHSTGSQAWWLLNSFVLLFAYSLFSAFSSILDSMKYAERRVEFLQQKVRHCRAALQSDGGEQTE